MQLLLWFAPLVVVAAAAHGCSEPLSSCEQSVLPSCDVADAACQAALGEHVACARGVVAPAEPLDFKFISVGEFEARYGAEMLLADDLTQCLAIAELWPFAPAKEGFEATARFDTMRREVAIAEPTATDAILRAIVQGQRDAELGGFGAWRQAHGGTIDQEAALDALFAGEGQLFADIAALKTVAREDAELRKVVDVALEDYDELVRGFYGYARSREFTIVQLAGHMPAFGARFALKTYLAQDPGALAGAYARPVHSGAELIRGLVLDAPPVEPEAPAVVPGPYTLRTSQRLGAWAYYSLLARVDPPPPPSSPFSEPYDESDRFAAVAGRWAGDRFDCYTDPSTGDPLVVWDVAFDPTVSLDDFTITQPTLATWRWVERENSLTLVIGFDEAVVVSIADGLP